MNQYFFVRRCHVCGTTTESEQDILKCSGCSKSLLPFFYFDKKKVPEEADNRKRAEYVPGPDSKGYGPIRGLTAYW